jgi:hypothetical protein
MEFVSATAQREAVIAVADSGEILTDPSDDWRRCGRLRPRTGCGRHVDRAGGKDDPPLAFIKRRPDDQIGDADHSLINGNAKMPAKK